MRGLYLAMALEDGMSLVGQEPLPQICQTRSRYVGPLTRTDLSTSVGLLDVGTGVDEKGP